MIKYCCFNTSRLYVNLRLISIYMLIYQLNNLNFLM